MGSNPVAVSDLFNFEIIKALAWMYWMTSMCYLHFPWKASQINYNETSQKGIPEKWELRPGTPWWDPRPGTPSVGPETQEPSMIKWDTGPSWDPGPVTPKFSNGTWDPGPLKRVPMHNLLAWKFECCNRSIDILLEN